MDLLTQLLIAAQIGVIGAVSALVAPTVFQALQADAAGAFLRRMFPRYFVTAAVVALAASVTAATGGSAVVAGLLGLDCLCFVAARALVPAINAAKDRGDPAFGRLHGASVLLNLAGLALAIAALALSIAGY